MSSITDAIAQLCQEIQECDVSGLSTEEIKDYAEAVRSLSQAYNLLMDADLSKRNMDLHEEQFHQLPGETPVSGARRPGRRRAPS